MDFPSTPSPIIAAMNPEPGPAMRLDQRAVHKATWRLIPYLFMCYILNYLDRFNISYAALEMKADLHFSDTVYSLGAGVFFIGYVLFEIPSNLALEKVGARAWISRIMVTWGLISVCMMFIHTASNFYALRFLLGVSEAGFFPGILLYLSYWIPSKDRARAFALFLTSTSLAGVLGGPISAYFLNLRGQGGMQGWQWLFLLEGLPSFLLGFVTYFYLTDKPRDAKWLTEEERNSLEKTMEEERRGITVRHSLSLTETLTHPRVWRLCLLYFSIVISFYGVAFWLPQIVKGFSGLDNVTVSLLSALPYLAASVGMVWVARHSDKTGERRRHVAVCAFTAALALLLGSVFQQDHPYGAFLMLCVTATGIWSTLGPFWSMPSNFLTGRSAAAGLALINSVGNIGGFVGPNIIGYIKEATQRFESGMVVLAVTLIVAGVLALSISKEHA